jgi:hypothetical protein
MKTAFVRDCLLWAARKLHRRTAGRTPKALIVTISDDRGEAVLRISSRSAEAPIVPPWQSISSELPGGDQVRAFSDDEELILAAVKSAGIISLKSLIVRTRIKRSRCALLASNLKDRGAIESGTEGYSLKQFQDERTDGRE